MKAEKEITGMGKTVMMRSADGGTLQKFMVEMKRLTGLRLCLYDLSYFTEGSTSLRLSLSTIRSHTSPLCELMKSKPDICAKCVEVENWRSREAARHPNGFLHTCYAGVTDFILPVRVHNQQVGALMIGQVLAENSKKIEELIPVLATYGFSQKQIRQVLSEQPRHSKASLRRSEAILGLIRDYIERTEELQALGREYGFLLAEEAPTAQEAVRTGKLPFRRLHALRSRLQGRHAEPFRKAIDIVQKRYASDIKLEGVAREVGMSSSYFSREFHRCTAVTFRRVVLETKLNVVLYLAKRYGTSITEAAYMAGYSDEFSFRRAFRKVTGLSPTVFMKRFPRAFDVLED